MGRLQSNSLDENQSRLGDGTTQVEEEAQGLQMTFYWMYGLPLVLLYSIDVFILYFIIYRIFKELTVIRVFKFTNKSIVNVGPNPAGTPQDRTNGTLERFWSGWTVGVTRWLS